MLLIVDTYQESDYLHACKQLNVMLSQEEMVLIAFLNFIPVRVTLQPPLWKKTCFKSITNYFVKTEHKAWSIRQSTVSYENICVCMFCILFHYIISGSKLDLFQTPLICQRQAFRMYMKVHTKCENENTFSRVGKWIMLCCLSC